MADNEGSIRLLTLGELCLAKSVFGNSIPYHTVWIHHDSYLPLGLQKREFAMSPNGELYFRDWFRDDFSREKIDLQHLFIHEMTHVWQRERGMQVRLRGLFSWNADYGYRLDGRRLAQYPLEQQAQIVADNFVLETYGLGNWIELKTSKTVTSRNIVQHEADLKALYKVALRNFPNGL
ncbi:MULTISPECIES: type VI secretion protein [Enterobacteriaceae]|uniref:type VI secretion protein n=1 Tax=Enterobacteriaceae TaxID=543 RepID=UPI0009034086|nr:MULTISPECIES: type VI secretion protein [Enterobacteriaceae]PDO87141.1 type VI secretion protein [Kosakonia sacchari]